MNNLLKELAADPSCILALFPDNGGEWCSPIHTPQPRDFTKEYHWDKLHAALQSLPWENDYHFEFKFTVHDFDTGSHWIMYQSAGRIVFSIGKDGRGCRFVFGSYSFTDSAPIYTSFVPSLTGEHVVTVAVVGSTFKVTVDGTPYEKSGERVASSEYDRAIMTVAPVSIHSVTLTDDTASSALWSAGYSELYDTNIPTPSSIPRNFATEPATWYDLGLASSTIGMDDWEIGGELYANSLTAGKSIIYRSSNPRFGLYVTSSSQIIFVNYSATGGSERIYYYDNPPTGEWLSFKMQRAGGWLRWLINDIEVNSVEKTGLYVEMNNASPFFVNEDCNLRNCYFKNLTTGRTVWSYPSDAERVRLITKTNVRTDRGVFEAVDVSKLYYVDTQLDLRGYDGDITIIAHINIAAESAPSSAKQYHILTQGGPNTQYTQTVYAMYITRYPDDTLGFKFLISDGTRWFEVEKKYSELTLDQIHTIGVVVIKETREQRWFVNGSYIGSVTVPAVWTRFNNTTTAVKNTRLGPHVLNTNYWPTNLPKYEAAYCFLRALSDAEVSLHIPPHTPTVSTRG
jgi:hypothetical protein